MIEDTVNTIGESEEAWSELIPKFIKLPWTAYKHRRLLHYRWLCLKHSVNLVKTNIVVTGRPGVGKSILLDRLKLADKAWDWTPPERSRKVESHVVWVGKWARIVKVIPGDTMQERDLGIHEAFSSHEKLEGVVYVADWGYTREREIRLFARLIYQKMTSTQSKNCVRSI